VSCFAGNFNLKKRRYSYCFAGNLLVGRTGSTQ
jgi:hypothetical protein